MSYIKLSDAKNAIMNCIGAETVSKYATSAECRAARHGADLAMFALDDCPTADVVEVVRCKDCLYSHFNTSSLRYSCQREYPRQHREEDDYCSYGKRREE